MNARIPDVLAVLFDMDGTITRPIIDFNAIRADMGVPPGQAILEYLDHLEGPEREQAQRVLAAHETAAALNSELNLGARDLLEFLDRRHVRTAIITRNNRNAVDIVCKKHNLAFDFVITAEDGPPKPSPEPVYRAARALDIPIDRILVVGDFLYDVASGAAAGTRTVFLTNGKPPTFDVEADFIIDSLNELIHLLD